MQPHEEREVINRITQRLRDSLVGVELPQSLRAHVRDAVLPELQVLSDKYGKERLEGKD